MLRVRNVQVVGVLAHSAHLLYKVRTQEAAAADDKHPLHNMS